LKGVHISDNVQNTKQQLLESPYQTPQRSFTDPFSSVGSAFFTKSSVRSFSSLNLFSPVSKSNSNQILDNNQYNEKDGSKINENESTFSKQRSPLKSNFGNEESNERSGSTGLLTRKRKTPTPSIPTPLITNTE
jgi:hypothetical protein